MSGNRGLYPPLLGVSNWLVVGVPPNPEGRGRCEASIVEYWYEFFVVVVLSVSKAHTMIL